MKKEIFTKEDLELAFSAGYNFAQDSFNNPDNAEYVNERIALKQPNIVNMEDDKCITKSVCKYCGGSCELAGGLVECHHCNNC